VQARVPVRRARLAWPADRKVYEASRPNHPERAPREQLQMAFERVLESLGQQPRANDESTATPDSESETGDGAPPQGSNSPSGRGKRRHNHGRGAWIGLTSRSSSSTRIQPN
jgi:hypothetical protein